jgi:plasmid stabilization system protein ParE
MTLSVVFRRPALREYEAALLWCEAKRAGLGSDLETEVTAAVEAAAEHPLRFPRMYKEVRCVRVHRFPYSVFFLPESTRIVVLAVFHARRDPSIWRSRA